MSDDESIESIEIGKIKGSKEYLNSLEENNKEYTLSDLLTEEINPDLEREIKLQAQKKVSNKAYRERLKGDPEKLAKRQAQQKVSDKAYRERLKGDPEKLAKLQAQKKESDKARYERLKGDPEKLAKRQDQKKASRERVAKRKRAKNTSLSQGTSAFLTAQNSDKKDQNSHNHSTATTNAQSSSKRPKMA